jgi:hypothetical protein
MPQKDHSYSKKCFNYPRIFVFSTYFTNNLPLPREASKEEGRVNFKKALSVGASGGSPNASRSDAFSIADFHRFTQIFKTFLSADYADFR